MQLILLTQTNIWMTHIGNQCPPGTIYEIQSPCCILICCYVTTYSLCETRNVIESFGHYQLPNIKNFIETSLWSFEFHKILSPAIRVFSTAFCHMTFFSFSLLTVFAVSSLVKRKVRIHYDVKNRKT